MYEDGRSIWCPYCGHEQEQRINFDVNEEKEVVCDREKCAKKFIVVAEVSFRVSMLDEEMENV